MVRSMVAGVAGLKTHQAKLDVIGNNIANVNTWGYKSQSVNFQDSMYATSISGSAGNDLNGGSGGRNASQVGYGVETGSIMASFTTGAPSPSSDPMDCMIDGSGFFLVGGMVNGSFTNISDSGLNLSRVGIFRVDSNGYLTDDQGSYVYGYALAEGTGIPETPATKAEYSVTGAEVTITDKGAGTYTVNIGGVEVETNKTNWYDQVKDWVTKAASQKGSPLEDYAISLDNYQEPATGGGTNGTVNLTITAKSTGPDQNGTLAGLQWGNAAKFTQTNPGNDRIAGIAAEFNQELSVIQIPTDPDTGEPYQLQDYSISEDGTVIGLDSNNQQIVLGRVALVSVQNPNGLEKTEGYYYSIGDNAGSVEAVTAGSGPAGTIRGGALEMANVDLANEFTQMITTQRGYQANSKIITVTDEMLEQLVNIKR